MDSPAKPQTRRPLRPRRRRSRRPARPAAPSSARAALPAPGLAHTASAPAASPPRSPWPARSPRRPTPAREGRPIPTGVSTPGRPPSAPRASRASPATPAPAPVGPLDRVAPRERLRHVFFVAAPRARRGGTPARGPRPERAGACRPRLLRSPPRASASPPAVPPAPAAWPLSRAPRARRAPRPEALPSTPSRPSRGARKGELRSRSKGCARAARRRSSDVHPKVISSTSYVRSPPGIRTLTSSPTCLPMSDRARGLEMLRLPFARSASSAPMIR